MPCVLPIDAGFRLHVAVANLSLQTSIAGRAAVIALSGELDLAGAAALERELARLEADSRRRRRARPARRRLHGLQRPAADRPLRAARAGAGRRLALVPGAEQVMRVFEITRMRERLDFVEDPREVTGARMRYEVAPRARCRLRRGGAARGRRGVRPALAAAARGRAAARLRARDQVDPARGPPARRRDHARRRVRRRRAADRGLRLGLGVRAGRAAIRTRLAPRAGASTSCASSPTAGAWSARRDPRLVRARPRSGLTHGGYFFAAAFFAAPASASPSPSCRCPCCRP